MANRANRLMAITRALGLEKPAFWIYEVLNAVNPAIVLSNARYRIGRAADQLPIPPDHLIFLTVGTRSVSHFISSGAKAHQNLTEFLAANGIVAWDFHKVLDFGCGCGRVIRHLGPSIQGEINGSDYNHKLIEWCQDQLPFGHYSVNGLSPPTAYENNTFDLVYAFSVFTHLRDELQLQWVSELRRILKPGGFLVFSTHGQAYRKRLTTEELREFDGGRLITKSGHLQGSNICSRRRWASSRAAPLRSSTRRLSLL